MKKLLNKIFKKPQVAAAPAPSSGQILTASGSILVPSTNPGIITATAAGGGGTGTYAGSVLQFNNQGQPSWTSGCTGTWSTTSINSASVRYKDEDSQNYLNFIDSIITRILPQLSDDTICTILEIFDNYLEDELFALISKDFINNMESLKNEREQDILNYFMLQFKKEKDDD